MMLDIVTNRVWLLSRFQQEKTRMVWPIFYVLLLVGFLSATLTGCKQGYVEPYTLRCSFDRTAENSITVRWILTNHSDHKIWYPCQFGIGNIVYKAPEDAPPYIFLVPRATMMAVSGLFDTPPMSTGIILESRPLIQVAPLEPGQKSEGQITISLPFTVKEIDLESIGGRYPNPFTPWPEEKELMEEVEKEAREAGGFVVYPHMKKIRKIKRFQMIMQVYRLPEGVPRIRTFLDNIFHMSASDYKMTKAQEKNTLLPDVIWELPKPWDLVDIEPVVHGRYFGNCLIHCRRRSYLKLEDLSEWVISPIYKVDWPVGEHPRVGLRPGLSHLPDVLAPKRSYSRKLVYSSE